MIRHQDISPDGHIMLLIRSKGEGAERLVDLGLSQHRLSAGRVERDEIKRAMGREKPIESSWPQEVRIFLGIFNHRLGELNRLDLRGRRYTATERRRYNGSNSNTILPLRPFCMA